MVTEEQAKQVLKTHGWTPRIRVVRGTTKNYLYAYRKLRGKVEEKYIGKVEALAEMAETDVLKRLS